VPSEEYDNAVRIGGIQPLADGRVVIVDYDPDWPRQFEDQAARIRQALGKRVLLLEHVGSTSVPGLPAKPVIDILLAVPNSADEPAYVPDLEKAGYVLRIREADWYEHRNFKSSDIEINLHVFTIGCVEIDRMLRFRDWLRAHPEDRELYVKTKRELSQRRWRYTQQYADAKSEVVEQILRRAGAEGSG